MTSKWDPSKWELHQLYSKHSTLGRHVPSTSLLTPESLSYYLKKYNAVYIKGKNSHTGSGIIKAWTTDKGYCFVKVKGIPVSAQSIDDLYRKVKGDRPWRSVIVQEAIDLATINGRPFTIRLMLMRNGERKWKYAGLIAKVSGEGSVISNVRRGGGYATTIEDALARSLGYTQEKIERVKEKLIRIGNKIIRHAVTSGYRTHESGLDLGIDKKGKIWIVEVNLAYPSYALFDRLEDKTYYRRIKKLAEDYRKHGIK